ncbi:polysaccharide export protein [Thalassovita mediterranea]|nr:polysaccharide export protein [Thalassovita mediterranea]
MTRLLTSLCFLASFFVSACSLGANSGSTGTSITAQDLPLPDTTSIVQSSEVRIGPMDIVQVKVFGVDELNGSYQVDYLGRIKMPLIGEVIAKDLTALQLANTLEKRLEDNYLQDADVTVSVEDSDRERVTVEGSVTSPGIYPVEGSIGLLQAVALAGGPTQSANPRKVVIFRQVEGQRMAAAYDLTAIRRGDADDPVVFGNDIIVVDGSEARQTYGEILRSIPLLSLFLIL